jgi:hypothetical protein
VDRVVCFLNSAETPQIIFVQEGGTLDVRQPTLMRLLQAGSGI